jgi:monoamine oxidase
MARTPLFDDVRRAFRIAASLERTKVNTSEGLERLEEGAWSRRRFLRTAVTATVGAAINPLLAQCDCACEPPRVVIVGAGVAGLVCAYRLQQNGIPARVIEASTRVGGRMFSLRNYFPDNQVAELGGELIDSEHTHLRDLAKELGLTLTDLAYDDGPNGHDYFFKNGPIKTDADFIDMFRDVFPKIDADLKQMKVRGEIDYETPHAKEVDNLSIEQWFSKRDVTGTISDILTVAYRGENGLEIGEQSALNLLTMMGEQRDAEEPDLFGKSDERYHIAEGNDSVPIRLAQKLDCPVELGSWLEGVSMNGRRYTLAVKRDANSVNLDADIVVFAIPFTTLRNVDLKKIELPEEKRRAINELGYGTNAKLMAGLSRRVWQQITEENDIRSDRRYTGYTFSDLPFQCCWETSRGQPGTHAILTNFVGGHYGEKEFNQGTVGDRASAFIADIEKIYPGSQAAFTSQAIRQHWPSSPFVRGSYTCFKRGQVCAFADNLGTPVGQIYFAGEHTSDANGFMEGGVRSGERVAKEIVKKVGRRRARAKAT